MSVKAIDLVTHSKESLDFFVGKCNEDFRADATLSLYQKIITKHREANDIKSLINDDDFIKLIHSTLRAWDMDQRGARMACVEDFSRSVRNYTENLAELYNYKLYDDIFDDLSEIKRMLKPVFLNLKVMESTRKIVGVSKVLHFLLPDLIMPIDGKFTLNGVFGYNKNSKDHDEEFKTFCEVLDRFYEIKERLDLGPEDVDGEQWNQSVPKLIDNALIGFLVAESEEISAFLEANRQ
ncbi:hypothetical protein [Geomonas propionica]|uniref:Uncharacterized protein n=1 Tax=Geomonas propionica TaxID=2798582 RepID=A0ABS0YQI7_9BACT|nr:hypothetical protein [Geomonas propionica]MBJ6799760.1 hypothetical protein [Geomonas propionica]